MTISFQTVIVAPCRFDATVEGLGEAMTERGIFRIPLLLIKRI